MDRQPEDADLLALNAPAELTDDLAKLVEKRTMADRRRKQRRGGPPRRALVDLPGEETPRSESKERRGNDRRRTGKRRQKPRREE